MMRCKRQLMIGMIALIGMRLRAGCSLPHPERRSGRLQQSEKQKMHRPAHRNHSTDIESAEASPCKVPPSPPAKPSNPHSLMRHRSQNIQRCGFLPWVLSVA